MIIFTVLGIFTAIFFFVVILMTIIETRIKNKSTEKFLWNMDKVEIREGGLEQDTNRTYSEIQKQYDSKTQ